MGRLFFFGRPRLPAQLDPIEALARLEPMESKWRSLHRCCPADGLLGCGNKRRRHAQAAKAQLQKLRKGV